jgi:ubiquinone/menaquinone biosynthesis C-methylase UbiE
MAMASRQDDVQRLFDLKAPTWYAKYDAQGPLAERSAWFVRAVRELRRPPADLLDFGCGSGSISRALADVGYAVSGCDLSPGMIRMARKTSVESAAPISWIEIDASAACLPFEDRSFDVIIASSVFEYLSDPLISLRQLRRVVRDDGLLLCTVPNIAHGTRHLESVLALAATRPLERLSSRVSQRLSMYISYLRLSRNRLPLSGWDELARSAGFQGGASAGAHGNDDSLLMLRFTPTPTA